MIALGKIQILDEHIANLIAAGEVVERPASIVKELMENSIDAGSTKIEVYIKEGGLSFIQVKDNGEGMDLDDVGKAFFRHATSKVKTSKDLFRIYTLGFRGEALPSIAAISCLTLKTSSNSEGKGVEVLLEGGEVKNKREIAYVKGTEITVENIFYNTPARLKYLKSLQTELGHIIDYVNRLSLSYSNISFSLVHNERLILRTKGDGQLQHVIAAIYGTSIGKAMIEFNNENMDFKLTGYVSKPEITRANKNHISIFVNGRYIKNFLVSHAIIKGLNTLLMVNRYPIAVLHIQLDHTLVDVNVHPAKLEARFSKEQELIKFVEETIKNSLNQHSFIREPVKSISGKQLDQKTVQAFIDLELGHTNNEKQATMVVSETKKSETPFSTADFTHKIEERIEKEEEFIDYLENQAVGSEAKQLKSKLPLLDPIAQFQGTYIIAQNEVGLYLIDQHAAHERINFEKNIALLNEEQIVSQELLVPLMIDFPQDEGTQILNKLDMLKAIGIEIEQFGPQTFIIRSVPQWIPKGQENDYIERITQMIILKNDVDLVELTQDMVANTSCKASIKANHYITKREMEVLLEQLRQTDNPYSCPHGRPIIIHFSINEIEKMFKRVV